LPLVHHLPSIEAGAVFVGLAGLEELLTGFVVRVDGDVVLPVFGLLVGFVVAPPVVFPPAGWADTPAHSERVRTSRTKISRKLKLIFFS